MDGSKVVVLIPCRDEATTIVRVVNDFRAVLPQARVLVYDNSSGDGSAELARSAGAEVRMQPRTGKGYVIEAMLADAAHDPEPMAWIMVDGDDTYPAEAALALLAPVLSGQADMVVGARLAQPQPGAFRPLHRLGNYIVRGLINRIFGARLRDILSGFRAFNRRVVEQLPIVSSGFEVETEMTVQLLYHRLQITEIDVAYRPRPPGSRSKLQTFRDGFAVLWTLFTLLRETKPLTCFGALAIVLLVVAMPFGLPPLVDVLGHRPVASVASALLAIGLLIVAAILVAIGILLHAINWRFKELHAVLARRGAR
jgi:glycosyltransferase involved in cell wall biosynthesis